jgi:hypothetical protein
MPAQIEARRLSGVDIGKTVEGTNVYGRAFTIKARIIEHGKHSVELWGPLNDEGRSHRHVLDPTDTVTITGKESHGKSD